MHFFFKFLNETKLTQFSQVAPICVHSLFYIPLREKVGWNSVVGIATRYGLEGPGIETR
jgi:hypothetical protein